MYLSQVNAHACSIEELSGENPQRGRSMYLEDVRRSTGILDDSRINPKSRRPRKERPHTIHWDGVHAEIMSGNYASGWQQPRENAAVGQSVIFSASQKRQHQQSYQQPQQQQQYQQPSQQPQHQAYQPPQQQQQQAYQPPQPQHRATPAPHGRRPIGRYGSRPSADSKELVGGNSFNPKGNKAADMFQKARERVDKYTVDDETPQSIHKARQGTGEEEFTPQPGKGRSRPQSKPAAKPTPRPVSQPPPSTSSSFATDYGAPSHAPQQQYQPTQQQAQRQPQSPQPQYQQQPAQRQQQAARPAAQPQPRPVNPSTKGPQYDARTGQHANQPPPVTGCNWGQGAKRFHAGVQPYQDSYNRSAQGWASAYQDSYPDVNDYDPHAPTKSPNFQQAPKLDLMKTTQAKKDAAYSANYNKSAKGWNALGLQGEEAESLFNPNRPTMGTLAANFEQPKPKYGGQQQRAPQPQLAASGRPVQRPPPQQRPPQQQRGPPPQQQHRPPPQQQWASSAPSYSAAGSGGWDGMLETDDL